MPPANMGSPFHFDFVFGRTIFFAVAPWCFPPPVHPLFAFTSQLNCPPPFPISVGAVWPIPINGRVAPFSVHGGVMDQQMGGPLIFFQLLVAFFLVPICSGVSSLMQPFGGSPPPPPPLRPRVMRVVPLPPSAQN